MPLCRRTLSFSTITGTATISLTGTGVNTGASYPFDVLSLVSAFELLEISPNEASSATPYDHADLKYVGVTNDNMATGFVTNTKLYFAVVDLGNHNTAYAGAEFDISIDTNRDGTSGLCSVQRQTGGSARMTCLPPGSLT